MSMVWRISAGLTTVKPTPRISARCTSAARNSVKPSRSTMNAWGSRSEGISAGSVIGYPATAGRGSRPGKWDPHHTPLRVNAVRSAVSAPGTAPLVLGHRLLVQCRCLAGCPGPENQAFSGGFRFEGGQGNVLVWRISAGLTTVKPTPRISARCTSAARNSVKPSRSTGRTRGAAGRKGYQRAASSGIQQPQGGQQPNGPASYPPGKCRASAVSAPATGDQWHPSACRRYRCCRRCRFRECRSGW